MESGSPHRLTRLNKSLGAYPLPFLTFGALLLGACLFPFFPSLSHWIWYAALVFGGAPIIIQTFRGIFQGHFASDIVASLAIITAIFMNQAFAGAVIVLMQSGGEALEAFGLRRASSSLTSLLARAPHFALRKNGENLEKIDVQSVEVGDILIVRGGDLIPVDGTILKGSAEIDEAALTGEPLARSKTVLDIVLSGSVNVNGFFEMRADRRSADSQYEKIVQLVKKAQEEKAPIQRLADRYAILFTPLTLFMSVLGFVLTRDPVAILAVLVVATPCPLILATPLAILCGINKSAKNKIIVKGGAALEQIGASKVVVFDKTGTITYGTPTVEEIVSFNSETPEELLVKAAALEQLSSHSIAKAVVEKAKGHSLPIPMDFKEIPGSGVEGKINGDHFLIGSESFLKKQLGAKAFEKSPGSQGKVRFFIAKNHICIGFFSLSDKIRPNIAKLVQTLRSLGVLEIIMLTGDSKMNAEVTAHEAGINLFQAELLPDQKAQIVAAYKEKMAPVTMIGDGINDAPALATATVGVAMGAYGSALSAEAADIVLLDDDASKLADAIAISKQTLQIAKQSIFIGMGLSFCLMIFAAFGLIQPAIGALLQEVIDVAVILNALRVR